MPIDMSLATAPPKKRAASTSTRTSKAAATVVDEPVTQIERRTNGLMGIGQLVQAGFLADGWYADAATIGQHFGPIAHETSKIAETNETLAKPIDMIIEVGPYGALIAAVLPFGLQIAANHGWIDASRLLGQGVVPPAVLDAQMKTQMIQMQLQATKAQNAAMAEAAAVQKEFAEMQKEYETATV